MNLIPICGNTWLEIGKFISENRGRMQEKKERERKRERFCCSIIAQVRAFRLCLKRINAMI